MSLVAFGATVMTLRGAIPVEQVVAGDRVLTSRSRFRRVAGRTRWDYEGDLVVIDQLAIHPKAKVIRSNAVPEIQPNAEVFSIYDTLLGVDRDEWTDGIERHKRGLAMRARAIALDVPQAAVIIGISPEAILGRALLTMRADSRCHPTVVARRPYCGSLAHLELADGEADEFAVYDRYPVWY